MTQADQAKGGARDRFALVGTVLDRKFRVDRLVAEGGFGVVYQGIHLTLEKPVAIKVLKTPSEFNDGARALFIEKFANEAKTIARISHPNIVQALDFGVSQMPSGEPAPWMVLEWLTGQTLEAQLAERRGQGGRSPADVLQLMRPIFDAMAYAHDAGIAHRDIKPANVMVMTTRRGSTLRLMDFGIAKLMDSDEQAGTGATRTQTLLSAFSPQYAAPEQVSATRTGPWTDVHALGLIMTEMLTDQMAYQGEDSTTLLGAVLAPWRPTPKIRYIDVGPWEPVLAKALALRPDDRFKNAAEFLDALAANVPASAQPMSGAPPAGTGPYPAVPGAPSAPDPTTLRGAVVTGSVQVAPPPARSSAKTTIALVAMGGLIASLSATAFVFSRRQPQDGDPGHNGTTSPSPSPSPSPLVRVVVPSPPPPVITRVVAQVPPPPVRPAPLQPPVQPPPVQPLPVQPPTQPPTQPPVAVNTPPNNPPPVAGDRGRRHRERIPNVRPSSVPVANPAPRGGTGPVPLE
jgi:serine/threonine protein kinase